MEYVKKWSKGEVITTRELEFDKWIREGDDICQADREDAIQQHSISEPQDGSQGEGDICQAEGEDTIQHYSIEGLHKKTLHRKITQERMHYTNYKYGAEEL